jgi:hypothetical protein
MNYESEYKKSIIRFFDFLIRKHNYKVLYENAYKMVLCSTNCQIHFTIDRSQLFIDFEPIGTLKKSSQGKDKYDMLTAVNSLNMGIHLEYSSDINTETDSQNEVSRLSQIMLNYCRDIINGDLNTWKTVISKYQGISAF